MFRAFAILCLALSPLLAMERTALLPFADFTSNQAARDLFMHSCAKYLIKRGFELAAKDSVELSLRKHRIRNTALPDQIDLTNLASDLNVPFVLTGSIHRFTTGEDFSEAAVSARLIRAADGALVWSNSITVAGGGEAALFTRPAYAKPSHLAKVASRKLLKSAKQSPKPRKMVTALRNATTRDQNPVTCARIAVIPPINEAQSEFVGDLFGDILVSEMTRRGFCVLDPGLVRQVMLQTEDLRYGQTVETLSRALADSFNVDLVLTGSVSELTDAHAASMGSIPRTSAELRLTDPNNNTVVWSRALEKSGSRNIGLFSSRVTRSPATLAHKLVREAIGDMKVVRSRKPFPQENTTL